MDLAIIGIDALDPDLVDEWADDLDTLSRLTDRGAFGRMCSSYPPLSMPAWPTLYTGKQGGKHGVFGFTESVADGYDRRPVNFDSVTAESLWEALDDAGFNCGVANVPLTYPPADLDDGYVLSGWPAPNTRDICTDPALLEELESALGTQYEVNPYPLTLEFDELSNEELFERISRGLHHHGEAFQHLLDLRDVDVFFPVFMAIDVASHNFAWERAYLKDMYEQQDAVLGSLLDELPDDTDVIVTSDHGHGARSEYSFHVNEWLSSRGYLETSGDGLSLRSLLERVGVTQKNYVRLKNMTGLGGLHERLPPRVYDYLVDAVPRGDSSGFDVSQVAWESTDAYSTEMMLVFVNDTSKPEGHVENPNDVRAAIAEELQSVEYPDSGETLAGEIIEKEECFEGPHFEEAPDLVVVPDGMRANVQTALNDGSAFSDERWGEHRQYGVLLTAGPSFASGSSEESTIVDVFPTVLATLGVDIPRNTDGNVLHTRFREEPDVGYRESRDNDGRTRTAGYDESESEEVREQLEGLGYLQ